MKKSLLLMTLLSFPAFADVFILPEVQDVLYESAYPFNEYLILDANKKCVFHYLSETAPVSDNVILIENATYPDTCLEKGAATVHIKNQQGATLSTFDGYFLNGFFIGNLPLNSQAVRRTSDEEATQYLDFLIEEDKQLNIRYIGTMHSFLDEKGYGAFDACAPFEITLQTQNKSLFLNKDTLQNLLTVVKSYAQTLCPSADIIQVNASDSPSLKSEGVFFTQTLTRAENGQWIWNDDTFKQSLPQQPEEERKIHAPITAVQLLDKSVQTRAPVQGEFVAHVSNKTNEKAVFIDTPFIIKALGNSLNLKEGWYRVSGTLQPMNDFERKRSGISLNEKAGTLTIKSATQCQNSYCAN